MARAVVAILGLLVVGILAVQGFDAGLASAADDNNIDNETWAPSADSVTQLDNSGLEGAFYDNETAVYDSVGDPVDRGDDYHWYESNGTVEAVAGGELDGETEATITYEYRLTTDEQRGITDALAVIPRFLEVGIILGGVLLLLLFIKG